VRGIFVAAILLGLLPVIDRQGRHEPKTSEPPPPTTALLQELEKGLLSGENTYFILDPPGHSLRLMLKGAFLEEFPVQEVLVGRPRVAFFQAEMSSDWDVRVWTDGQLDPPRVQNRIEVTPPDSALALDSLQPALPVPPPPEEAYHVPPVYRILFPGGLTIVVESPADSTAQGVPSRSEMLRSRVVERLQEFNASIAKETVRVRLKMGSETAQRLYRSYPKTARFLVVPGFTAPEPPKLSRKK
jgi:hypothetical protein